MEKILCVCGCGKLRPKYDKRGRLRKYIHGHYNNRRKTPKEIIEKMRKNMTKFNLTKKFLIEEYVGKEKSSREIAEEVGCCDETILLKLEKYRIKRRTKLTKKQQSKRILKIKGKRNPKCSETRKRLFREGKLKPIKYWEGKHLSKRHRKNIGLSKKGEKNYFYKKGEEFKGEKNPNYGNHKLKGVFSKEKHPNWQGGKSFEIYGVEFDDDLREKIRKRDNFICQECGKTEEESKKKLSIHHIDYDKKNNHFLNLIGLCKRCHCKTGFNREHWERCFKERMVLKQIFNPENLLVFKDKKLIEVISNV